jgi:hypothetical protein
MIQVEHADAPAAGVDRDMDGRAGALGDHRIVVGESGRVEGAIVLDDGGRGAGHDPRRE